MSTDNPEQPAEDTSELEAAAMSAEADDAPVEETPSEAKEELVLEIGSTASSTHESAQTDYEPVVRGKLDKFDVAMGTGRRKTSVARVRIKEGDGKIIINGREIEDFFPIERDRKHILLVLEKTEQLGKVDIWVRVTGGGTTGQTGAVVLGVARALHVLDPSLHDILTEYGFLTRDSRMVERKKYGFKKARRSFQFSKR
jgi:small subunit ribosomal protein S9